jgi:hypothetical protein
MVTRSYSSSWYNYLQFLVTYYHYWQEYFDHLNETVSPVAVYCHTIEILLDPPYIYVQHIVEATP